MYGFDAYAGLSYAGLNNALIPPAVIDVGGAFLPHKHKAKGYKKKRREKEELREQFQYIYNKIVHGYEPEPEVTAALERYVAPVKADSVVMPRISINYDALLANVKDLRILIQLYEQFLQNEEDELIILLSAI